MVKCERPFKVPEVVAMSCPRCLFNVLIVKGRSCFSACLSYFSGSLSLLPPLLECRDSVHTGAVDVQCGRGVVVPPVVHDHLLGLIDVEQQVVFITSLYQPLHLISVSRLIAVSYESHQGGVICKFDY